MRDQRSPEASGFANTPGATMDQPESQAEKSTIHHLRKPLGDVYFHFSVSITLTVATFKYVEGGPDREAPEGV